MRVMRAGDKTRWDAGFAQWILGVRVMRVMRVILSGVPRWRGARVLLVVLLCI